MNKLLHLSKLSLDIPGSLTREIRARNISRNCKIAGRYKRIYHYHVRKTAGTSINFMFLATATDEYRKAYRVMGERFDNREILGNKVFVGWNRTFLRLGHYYYGFSHLPFESITIPKQSFTFTMIRDPIQRALSYYRMIAYYSDKSQKPLEDTELPLIKAGDFISFLDKVGNNRLMRQVYMFSKKYDLDEAYERITNLSYFCLTERFEEGVNGLNKRLKTKLTFMHENKGGYKFKPTAKEITLLKERLEPSFVLYERLKKFYNKYYAE